MPDLGIHCVNTTPCRTHLQSARILRENSTEEYITPNPKLNPHIFPSTFCSIGVKDLTGFETEHYHNSNHKRTIMPGQG